MQYADLEREAKAADARYAADTVAVENSPSLSAIGKAEKLQEAEQKRQTAVHLLQIEAQDRLQTEVTAVQRELRKAEADEVDRLRASVGDALLVSHYRRQLADMTPDEISTAIADAVSDWQRDVLRILAIEELDARVSRGGDGAMLAHVALRHVQYDMQPSSVRSLREKLRDLQVDAERYIESLDLVAYRRNAEDTLGVRAQYVTSPY